VVKQAQFWSSCQQACSFDEPEDYSLFEDGFV
jgi:hypothetical protein